MEKEYAAYDAELKTGISTQERENLATLVMTEIKKPVKGNDYGVLLPIEREDSDMTDVKYTDATNSSTD